MNEPGPILLFDGVCNVCNASVRFVVAHEARPEIRFASLQSSAGRALVHAHGLPDDVSTVVLVHGDRTWTRSAAVVQVLRRMRMPWRVLTVIWLIPAPIRDVGYAVFARFRYRLFGMRASCMVPTPELKARFLQ